ncbi:TRAP transporter substrate-binding protein [Roseicitreum antarcticum]|uniref:Tripartite ATP-independent transporter solute receptor, DctP family n=1 Tax=Roseicitreum antarcticum TaxID=564137 RepID=A0A1H2YLA1_9RHOB|nr:TRAP transporter substrate-binding protein [Roseicitreum antarcticum]SDX05957.1 tripartite ATP-independent transporter solute receptor, DctP family [Roseicitreum antarcticum]
MRYSNIIVGAASVIALSTAATFAADVTMRVGTVYQTSHTISQGSAEFERLVEERSNGEIDVQVFYAEELGSEREMAEMTRAGGLEMVLSGLPGTGAFVPQIEVMEAFYTYDNLEELATVVGAIADDLNAFMEPQGFHLVGYMYQGPRNLLSTRPVREFDDMAGLRLRIPQTPLFVALAQSWNATPTAISLGEVYTSLESGVIDAVEGTSETIVSSRFYENANYLTVTRHNFYPQPMVVNKGWWDGLSEEHQAVINESAQDAAAYQLSLHKDAEAAAMQTMRDSGVEIIEVDTAPFSEPVLAAMDEYIKSKGEEVYAVYQKMLETAAEQ